MNTTLSAERGFTALQVVAGLGIPVIWGMLLLTIGSGILSSPEDAEPPPEVQAESSDDPLDDLRDAVRSFVKDVRIAVVSDLLDGAEPASELTLLLADGDDEVSQTLITIYKLEGDTLTVSYDGSTHTIVRDLVAVGFTLSGDTITGTFEVRVGPDATRSLSVAAEMSRG